MHHALCITRSPHNNGGSDELLRFVQSRAICDEETEFTVRLASDAENGYFLTCFAAEIHRRADLTVRMNAYHCAGVLACQVACCHTAVPEGDGILLLIHGNRITEEGGIAGQFLTDVHGERTINVCLTACANACRIQKGQYGAYRSTEIREEIRPAAGRYRADSTLGHIVGICLVKLCKIFHILIRSLVQTSHAAPGLVQIFCTLPVGIAFCLIDQLSCLDCLQRYTEGTHHFGVQCTSKTEALWSMADRSHLQMIQLIFYLSRSNSRADLCNYFILLRRTEYILEFAVPECLDRI